MDLFILRHGKAGKPSFGHDGPARVLTRKGKDEIKEVARWIKLKKFKFDSIATRPLKRAHETATIIASFLGQEDKLTT
ncbi:MAG TPA: histidine phosphatase family protein [Methanoregula sp.]|nr:histidine phosphatase family protein [Methanoregula sp.]